MKKILSLILALLCILTTFVGCNSEDSSDDDSAKDFERESDNTPTTSPVEDFEFESGSGGLIVTKYLGHSKKVVIPSVVDNKKVVDITPEVFGGNIVVEEIVLSEHMTSLYLSSFIGCDNLKAITYAGVTSTDYYGLSYADNLPKNLTTMNFPVLKTVDVNNFKHINNYAPQVTTYICENATELKEQSYLDYYDESINLVVPEVLVNDIKSKTLYVFDVYNREYDYYSGEYETTENWSEWGFKDSLLQIWADVSKGKETADTLIDESQLSPEFIEYIENLIDTYKKEGAINMEYYYFKAAEGNMVVKFQFKDWLGIEHGYRLTEFGSYLDYDDSGEYQECWYFDAYLYYNLTKTVTDANGVVCAYFGTNSITVNGVRYSYEYK